MAAQVDMCVLTSMQIDRQQVAGHRDAIAAVASPRVKCFLVHACPRCVGDITDDNRDDAMRKIADSRTRLFVNHSHMHAN